MRVLSESREYNVQCAAAQEYCIKHKCSVYGGLGPLLSQKHIV